MGGWRGRMGESGARRRMDWDVHVKRGDLGGKGRKEMWNGMNTRQEGREGEKKRTNAEIRGDSHSVLTENRSRRVLLIKRYWILVTLHSICWKLCSCAAVWNPILKGWFQAVLPLELQQYAGNIENPGMLLAVGGCCRSKAEQKKIVVNDKWTLMINPACI